MLNIDWEQRRYEIAKEVLWPMYEQMRSETLVTDNKRRQLASEAAVEIADFLVAELRKEAKR